MIENDKNSCVSADTCSRCNSEMITAGGRHSDA
jgi:hypothetical protein